MRLLPKRLTSLLLELRAVLGFTRSPAPDPLEHDLSTAADPLDPDALPTPVVGAPPPLPAEDPGTPTVPGRRSSRPPKRPRAPKPWRRS